MKFIMSCGVLLNDRKRAKDEMVMSGLKKKKKSAGYGKQSSLVWSCVEDGRWSCVEEGRW